MLDIIGVMRSTVNRKFPRKKIIMPQEPDARSDTPIYSSITMISESCSFKLEIDLSNKYLI